LRLLVRKEVWTLSYHAKLLVGALGLLLAVAFPLAVYPFLAQTQPVNSGTMIIEGWVSDSALSQAAAIFVAGHYHKILVLQGSDEADEKYIERTGKRRECNDHAQTLVNYGVPSSSIGTLLYPVTERDRTYHEAEAARDWLIQHSNERSFDVVTVGPHARRSKMMFTKAFGRSVAIGIIALNDPTYDPNHWWRTSEGVRDVLGEVIAYIYAFGRYTWS
jgi:uncharacterized SAM-binding protein YcdF (DUF218 family)